MKEYIIYFNNSWMRFFINRFGLCVSKMDNSRFRNFEILVPDAKCDFSAARGGNFLHLVCQAQDGSILYLTYDGRLWEKTVLLKDKKATPYNKYFCLIPIGNFMNLFYVINSGGKDMLIHQILDGSSLPPEVVDYINPVGIRYFACPDISTDIILCYQNIKSVCGTKIYRWSHKSFLQFMPVLKDFRSFPPFCKVTENGMQMCAPEKKQDGTFSLIFYFKNDAGEIQKTEIDDNCSDSADPIIFPYNNKTFIQWQDKGSIISSSSNDGINFTKPVKYVKNSSYPSTVYCIDNGSETFSCYGYGTENTIFFYSAHDILDTMTPKNTDNIKIIQKGQEISDFALRAGFKKSGGWEDDPYVTQKELKEEISVLVKQIDGYNKILDELNKKIEKAEKNILSNDTSNVSFSFKV